MASELERLKVIVEAESKGFQKGMKSAQSEVNKFRRENDKLNRKLQETRASMKRTGSSATSLGAKIGRLAKGLLVLGGVGSATGLAFASKRAIEFADNIAKTADSIGLSTTALQEYTHAAELSGVSTSSVQQGLGAFVKRLGELRAGTGALNTLLNKNNQALKEQLIAAESSEEALRIFFRALANVKDQADRAALSAAAFSRTAGIEMTNLVRDGSDALEGMRKEAQDLGLVMDEDLIRRAEEANDAIYRLSQVIKVHFTESLLGLFKSFKDANEGWTLFFDNVFRNLKLKQISKAREEFEKWDKAIRTNTENMSFAEWNAALEKRNEAYRILTRLTEEYNNAIEKTSQKEDETKEKIIVNTVDATNAVSDYIKKLQMQNTILSASAEEQHKWNITLEIAEAQEKAATLAKKQGIEVTREQNLAIAEAIQKKHELMDATKEQIKEEKKAIVKMQEFKDEQVDRFKEMKDAVEGFGRDFSRTMADMVATGEASFKELAQSFSRDFLEAAFHKAITSPLMGFIEQVGTGLFTSLFAGGKSTGTTVPQATPGGEFGRSGPAPGGESFAMGPRWPGTVPGNVTVINNTGVEATASVNRSGGNLEITLDNMISKRIASGGRTARAIENVYGLRRQGAY